MNRNEERWGQCYWKEWAAIEKRWDGLRATLRELAEGSSQNRVRLSRLPGHHPKGRLRLNFPNDARSVLPTPGTQEHGQ